jgi:hypothetical protein
LASLDWLAFFEADGFEFAIDLGANDGGVERRDVANGVDQHADVALLDHAHRHRLRAPARAKTA